MTTTHDLTLIRRHQRCGPGDGTVHFGHGGARFAGRVAGQPAFRCYCGELVFVTDEQLADYGYRVA